MNKRDIATTLPLRELNNWTTTGAVKFLDAFALYMYLFKETPNKIIFEGFQSSDVSLNRLEFYTALKEKLEQEGFVFSKAETIPLVKLNTFGDPTERYISCIAIHTNHKVIINYRYNDLLLFYSGEDSHYRLYLEKLLQKYMLPKTLENKVHLITQDANGYLDLTEGKVTKNKPVDLVKHYNDDFKPEYDKMVEFLKDRRSGLCILNGAPGTGKTNLIRHFINTVPNQYIILSNHLMNSITSPSFLSFMLENKDSVLILEDCEMLLADRSISRFSDGIVNILNMTDGLYSDMLNIKIIATFNADLTTIDKALLRNGRLIANYEFKPLTIEKTNALLSDLNKPITNKELTLAEIFYKSGEELIEIKKPKKIGF